MLHNIIDIDYDAMRISLKHSNGVLILFDFKAAFPSVSHEILIACLKGLGFPEEAMHFIPAMYDNNKCIMKIGGQFFPGCEMKGGVRQGCPLSPLLFAVVVDILLRMIEHRIASSSTRAFADDIAGLLVNWNRDGPILAQIFDEFSKISNLYLNIEKTVCIPLWPQGVEEVSKGIDRVTPKWADTQVCDKGVYLGFMVGLGKTRIHGTSLWTNT